MENKIVHKGDSFIFFSFHDVFANLFGMIHQLPSGYYLKGSFKFKANFSLTVSFAPILSPPLQIGQ